jgi:hypothetical protein
VIYLRQPAGDWQIHGLKINRRFTCTYTVINWTDFLTFAAQTGENLREFVVKQSQSLPKFGT